MADPADYEYQECDFCRTVVFDPIQTVDPVSGKALVDILHPDYADEVVYLGPTLDSIIAAEPSCVLAKWLVGESSTP